MGSRLGQWVNGEGASGGSRALVLLVTAQSCRLYCAAECSMDVKHARTVMGDFSKRSPVCAGVAFLLSHFLILIFLSVRPRKIGGTKFLKPAAGKSGTGFLNRTFS